MAKTVDDTNVETLAALNAEVSRAEALIERGNGRFARKILDAVRSGLESIPGGDGLLGADVDAALGRADALPTLTRPPFPNPAHADSPED